MQEEIHEGDFLEKQKTIYSRRSSNDLFAYQNRLKLLISDLIVVEVGKCTRGAILILKEAEQSSNITKES